MGARRALSQAFAAGHTDRMKKPNGCRMHEKLLTASLCAVALSVGFAACVDAQQTLPSPPAVSPATDAALNTESGTIEEMLTADDGDSHWLGYLVTWNGRRIFVPDPKHEVHLVGKKLNFTAVQSDLKNNRVLRFALVRPQEDTDPSINEAQNAQASMTAGTAPVEEVLSTDKLGYRFLAYVVSWHDKRVVVTDPASKSKYAVGDRIDFKVLHTVSGQDQQLSFVLNEATTPK
jgi:hypothetical protein